jgi:hypothetical protein
MQSKVVFSIALFTLCACALMAEGNAEGSSGRSAGSGETEIFVQRAQTTVNAGFKERVYIDGRQVLTLNNGESGRVIIPNGEHTIHADLYTLTTSKVPFSAQSRTLRFTITPYSLQDFAIETDENYTPPPPAPSASASSAVSAAAAVSAMNSAVYNDSGVEGSLLRATARILERISSRSRIAIVYVTANDADITEFIANELEFILVEQDMILIDRSQLDRIRQEQRFQISGEVDDSQAVSVGKIAGADIIITGAVTGTGELRRLRLRALDTQTGQVLSAASEKY